MAGFAGLGWLITKQPVPDLPYRLTSQVFIEHARSLAFRMQQGLDHIDSCQAIVALLNQFIRRAAQFRPGFGDGGCYGFSNRLQGVFERVQATARGGDNRVNLDAAQVPLQDFDGDVDAVGSGHIRHGHCHDHGQLHFHQLLQQVQALVQMRGVQYDQQAIRAGRAFDSAKQDIDGNSLVSRKAAQAIDSGQINQFQSAVLELHGTGMFLDRDARIISGGLAQSRQAVEQGAFSRIGIADYRYGCVCATADTYFFDRDVGRFNFRHPG